MNLHKLNPHSIHNIHIWLLHRMAKLESTHSHEPTNQQAWKHFLLGGGNKNIAYIFFVLRYLFDLCFCSIVFLLHEKTLSGDVVGWQWSIWWRQWRSEQSLSAWQSSYLTYITSLSTVVSRRVFADAYSFTSPDCCVSTPLTDGPMLLIRSGSGGSTTSCRCVRIRRLRPTASR